MYKANSKYKSKKWDVKYHQGLDVLFEWKMMISERCPQSSGEECEGVKDEVFLGGRETKLTCVTLVCHF